jgi:hypothetical protein
MRHTPVRCTPVICTVYTYEIHACEMHARGWFCEDLARQNVVAYLFQFQLGLGVVVWVSGIVVVV